MRDPIPDGWTEGGEDFPLTPEWAEILAGMPEDPEPFVLPDLRFRV
jgi:hypothetical protein